MPDARGVIALPIGELGDFNVQVTFNTIRKIEAKFGPIGELQSKVLQLQFGLVQAFEFLKLVLRETEQDRELPPDEVLQDELVKLGLTKSTVLCMPVLYLACDGAEAIEVAEDMVRPKEDEEGKAGTPSPSIIQ